MHDVGVTSPIPANGADQRFTAELVHQVRDVLVQHGYQVSSDIGVIELTCHLSHYLHGCGDHCHGHTLQGN